MMCDRDYQFLSEFLPAAVKETRFKVIDDMVRYLQQCVGPQYGHNDGLQEFSQFQTSVSAALFRFAARSVKLPKNFMADAAEKTAPMVVEAIQNGMRFASVERICVTHFTNKEIAKAVQTDTNAVQLSWNEPDIPSVESAFQMAQDNFIRLETGIVYLNAIYKMARPSPYSNFYLAGGDAVRSFLYSRREQFMKNILLFGGLLGGERAAEAVKMVARKMIYNPNSDINFSVIGYLQPFGCVPGCYLSKYEEDFMKDIADKYESL